MLIVGMVIGLILGLLFVLDSYEDRRKYKRYINSSAKQKICYALTQTDFTAELAKKLEIQADGGDDPAEFVEWAIREVWSDADSC